MARGRQTLRELSAMIDYELKKRSVFVAQRRACNAKELSSIGCLTWLLVDDEVDLFCVE